MISNFTQLLEAAKTQEQPQRLLFLFAQAETNSKKNQQKTGTLTPLMCVDKLPEELGDFASFCKEADQISKDWDMMIIAGLNGADGKAPSSDEAEPFLNQMANNLSQGQDLSGYVIFDRKENPIVIQR